MGSRIEEGHPFTKEERHRKFSVLFANGAVNLKVISVIFPFDLEFSLFY